MQQRRPSSLRTPLLKLQIERLKLNENAPYSRSKHARPALHLLKGQ
jgi:hypothetical protein